MEDNVVTVHIYSTSVHIYCTHGLVAIDFLIKSVIITNICSSDACAE